MADNTCNLWKTELEKFTETGEASNEFLAHLDKCEYCGAAVENAFNRQAWAFEKLAENLRNATERFRRVNEQRRKAGKQELGRSEFTIQILKGALRSMEEK